MDGMGFGGTPPLELFRKFIRFGSLTRPLHDLVLASQVNQKRHIHQKRYYKTLLVKQSTKPIDKVCGQKANRTKCQLKVGIFSGLFIVVGILSVPIFGWHFVQTISTCFGILSES